MASATYVLTVYIHTTYIAECNLAACNCAQEVTFDTSQYDVCNLQSL